MRRSLMVIFAVSAGALAQSNPITGSIKTEYGMAKDVIARSAEKVPESLYSFKPTDAVRSFGQLVGHVADGQYEFCSAAAGEKPPATSVEKTKTSKADLEAALKQAFAYCDKVFDGMTDSSGAQTVSFFGSNMSKLGILAFNNMHTYEHYGNMVTYMRLKDIVPPSSEQRPPAPKKK